jgi:hypothetical protein
MSEITLAVPVRPVQAARPIACALLLGLFAAISPQSAFADPDAGVTVTETLDGARLAAAAHAAVDDSEHDLDQMPFFIRPLARRSFAKRTGLSRDEWRERIDTVRTGDTPAAARARWPDAVEALTRLAEDFRTAPARAKEKMPDNVEALRAITASAAGRTAAVLALRDWIRG